MTQKIAISAPSHNFVGLYLRNKAYMYNLKKVVKQRSTCPRNMVNFGPLTAEVGSGVLGTSANFIWFRVLAALYCTAL